MCKGGSKTVNTFQQQNASTNQNSNALESYSGNEAAYNPAAWAIGRAQELADSPYVVPTKGAADWNIMNYEGGDMIRSAGSVANPYLLQARNLMDRGADFTNIGAIQTGEAANYARGAQRYVDTAADYSDQGARLMGHGVGYMDEGAGYARMAGAPVNLEELNVNKYLNPFSSYMLSGLNEGIGAQNKAAQGRMASMMGGVGGDRAGVAEGEKYRQDQLARGSLMAAIYQPALAAAQQQQGAKYTADVGNRSAYGLTANQLAGIGQGQVGAGQAVAGVGNQYANYADRMRGIGSDLLAGGAQYGRFGVDSAAMGTQYGGLGLSAQDAALRHGQAYFGVGEAARRLQQERLDNTYEQQLKQIEAPYKNNAYLAQIVSGLAPIIGGTKAGSQSSTGTSSATTMGNQVTQTQQSPLSTLMGLGMMGMGMATGNPMAAMGGLGQLFNRGSSGGTESARRGGRIVHKADGGEVVESYSPTIRERIVAKLLGDNPSRERRDFMRGVTGLDRHLQGDEQPGMSLIDLVPGLGTTAAAEEVWRGRHRNPDWKEEMALTLPPYGMGRAAIRKGLSSPYRMIGKEDGGEVYFDPSPYNPGIYPNDPESDRELSFNPLAVQQHREEVPDYTPPEGMREKLLKRGQDILAAPGNENYVERNIPQASWHVATNPDQPYVPLPQPRPQMLAASRSPGAAAINARVPLQQRSPYEPPLSLDAAEQPDTPPVAVPLAAKPRPSIRELEDRIIREDMEREPPTPLSIPEAPRVNRRRPPAREWGGIDGRLMEMGMRLLAATGDRDRNGIPKGFGANFGTAGIGVLDNERKLREEFRKDEDNDVDDVVKNYDQAIKRLGLENTNQKILSDYHARRLNTAVQSRRFEEDRLSREQRDRERNDYLRGRDTTSAQIQREKMALQERLATATRKHQREMLDSRLAQGNWKFEPGTRKNEDGVVEQGIWALNSRDPTKREFYPNEAIVGKSGEKRSARQWAYETYLAQTGDQAGALNIITGNKELSDAQIAQLATSRAKSVVSSLVSPDEAEASSAFKREYDKAKSELEDYRKELRSQRGSASGPIQ